MGKCEWADGVCFAVATHSVTVTRDYTDAGSIKSMSTTRFECINHAAAEMLKQVDTYVEPIGRVQP